MIVIEQLSKTYDKTDRAALDGVDLKIQDSEFVSIVGKSGSGKSTLLNIIGGIEKPSSGKITVGNIDLTVASDNELSDYRSKKTGFIFQSFHLEPQFSVYDNIRLPLLITGVPYGEHKKRIETILEKVDLSLKINDKTSKLSGGEKQRCAIARALVCDPPLILADEPCGNLDTENSLKIMNLLKSINEAGKGVILVTHDKEAAHYAKRIIELKDGRIINEIS
jgi:putative ABC transport system ATP-binding protein